MNELCRSVKSFISAGIPSNNEIEFRFSERGETNSISSDTFYHVLTSTNSETSLWTAKIIEQSSVIIGKHIIKGNPDIRQIKNKLTTSYEAKTRIRVDDRDFRDYNIRASEANEKKIEISEEDWSKTYIPTLQRNRKRMSFIDKTKVWQLDLTEIESYADSTIKMSYEIELEYISNSKLISHENIQTVFTFILQTIQKSNVIISNLFGKQLIGDYCNLLKINPRYPKFIGPLPFTLTKEIFQNGKLSCGYSVTEKADGDRKLLFIGKRGICLLISRPKDKDLQYHHIGTIPELENSIFDGEFVDNKIYLFDTLIFKNKDIRDHPLDHRISVFSKFPASNKCTIEVFFKTFYFSVNIYSFIISNKYFIPFF